MSKPTAPINVRTVSPAGSGQSTATALNTITSPAMIRVLGAQVGGIKLPPVSEGKVFYVTNIGPASLGALNVYPSTGGTINALAANAPFVMPGQSSVQFIGASTVRWDTFPRVAS